MPDIICKLLFKFASDAVQAAVIYSSTIRVICSFPFQALTALLADDNKFGFIVMDGNGALFGTLSGNTREVLHKFTVDLPKKHGKIVDICALLLHLQYILFSFGDFFISLSSREANLRLHCDELNC